MSFMFEKVCPCNYLLIEYNFDFVKLFVQVINHDSFTSLIKSFHKLKKLKYDIKL